MRIKERLQEIRKKGIEVKVINTDKLHRRSHNKIKDYEDGIEFIASSYTGRKYKEGARGYVAMRRILDELRVPARRLGEIRTDVHIITDGKAGYRFDYPADDYRYLTESS